MRWATESDGFGDPMAVLYDEDERVAEVRYPHEYMAFPMHRYQCKRCGDNLASMDSLARMKRVARDHQRREHGR